MHFFCSHCKASLRTAAACVTRISSAKPHCAWTVSGLCCAQVGVLETMRKEKVQTIEEQVTAVGAKYVQVGITLVYQFFDSVQDQHLLHLVTQWAPNHHAGHTNCFNTNSKQYSTI